MRIYGLAEIAEELGENVNTVRAWFFRGKLPAPTEKLKGGHVWQGEEIESWIIDRKGTEMAETCRVCGRETSEQPCKVCQSRGTNR